MKKPFEDYLDFLENDLSYKFFEPQKALLRKSCEEKRYIYISTYSGKSWIYEKVLREFMQKDKDNSIPCFYKPDGYSTDITVYDENFNNIE